ncbi:GFA family protein [uncultured Roseobacter sp.]|uniref:GFA family protein n=1 Tax=uncultured Roseobacter sp. TaxID=114847 RepID=UPI00263241E4|nr:GFA family protein [uncultured Roseobacter sp.]
MNAPQEHPLTARCLCGAVSVTITAKPAFIHECNCRFCRTSGGAWGYFAQAMVKTTGETVSFLRHDKANAAAELQFCRVCGTTTHWTFSKSFREQTEAVDLMGVNMRIFDPDDLKGVELRFPNGDGWSGAGPFDYRRTAITLSDHWPW